jgi:putative Mn2+ efflux pump MntP
MDPVAGNRKDRVSSRVSGETQTVSGRPFSEGFVLWAASARQGEKEVQDMSFGSWKSSLLAGLAISTDELAIGFPLGASRLPIGPTLAAIAVQTVFVTVMGVTFGNRVRSGLALGVSRYAGIAAGVVFALVGVWLVAEHFARG